LFQQFKSQADLDMYTHISTMIEQLRAASQAADERYAQKVDALPQAIEQATMEALRR
jgi:predicted HAD superfamily Cof-like phosphohydrolase